MGAVLYALSVAGLFDICREEVVQLGKNPVGDRCGPMEVTDILPFVLFGLVLLLPDISELSLPGLGSVKLGLRQQARRQDRARRRPASLEQTLVQQAAIHQQSTITQQPVIVIDLGQQLEQLPEKEQRFPARRSPLRRAHPKRCRSSPLGTGLRLKPSLQSSSDSGRDSGRRYEIGRLAGSRRGQPYRRGPAASPIGELRISWRSLVQAQLEVSADGSTSSRKNWRRFEERAILLPTPALKRVSAQLASKRPLKSEGG